VDRRRNPLDLDYVAVKAPQFSFRRLSGADPVLGVEMASTGEVACFGDDADEALLKAMIATGFRYPTKGIMLSLGPVGDKYRFTEEARQLSKSGLKLFATSGTAEMLREENIECEVADKGLDGGMPSAVDILRSGQVDLVINIPREYDEKGRPDGFRIRRCAIDLEIPLLTDLSLARKMVRAMTSLPLEQLKIRPWKG
jgi:carbamoyl-phosphate synthase large subunit